MNQQLYETARGTILKLQDLDFQVSGGSLPPKAAFDALYEIRRELENACDEHMKQGERIALTSEYKLTCPECSLILPNSDYMYLHLRKDHRMPEEEAAVACHEGKGQYDEEIATLRELLPKHTGVLIEDEDPFQTKEA